MPFRTWDVVHGFIDLGAVLGPRAVLSNEGRPEEAETEGADDQAKASVRHGEHVRLLRQFRCPHPTLSVSSPLLQHHPCQESQIGHILSRRADMSPLQVRRTWHPAAYLKLTYPGGEKRAMLAGTQVQGHVRKDDGRRV